MPNSAFARLALSDVIAAPGLFLLLVVELRIRRLAEISLSHEVWPDCRQRS